MSASEERSQSNKNIVLTEKSRRIAAVIIILLCAVVFAGLCFYQYHRFAKYEQTDLSLLQAADPADYRWDLDSRIDNGGNYLVNGWIARTGESINTRLIDLVIEKEDGTAYLVPTEMIERGDVSDKLNNGSTEFDYSASGFSAVVNCRYFSPGDRLFILYRNNGRCELIDLSATL